MQSKTIPGSIHFQHLLQVHCLNAYAQPKQIKEVSDLSPIFYPPCLSDHRHTSKLLFSAFCEITQQVYCRSSFYRIYSKTLVYYCTNCYHVLFSTMRSAVSQFQIPWIQCRLWQHKLLSFKTVSKILSCKQPKTNVLYFQSV